jgi:lactate dehydrogenase-like 2-hydroxyacid dehydrogenase
MTFAPATNPSLPAWEQDIRVREEALRVAILTANIVALDGLLAECYLVNSPLDRVLDKRQLLELLRTGRIRHSTFDVQIERVERHGETAVVMGHDSAVDPTDGVLTHRRFTNVWAHDFSVWRSIARHAHVVSREAPAGKY